MKRKDTLRYTLVRVYYNYNIFSKTIKTEEINCKTLKEAIDWGSILTDEEKVLSYIIDNAANKKLTLKGKQL